METVKKTKPNPHCKNDHGVSACWRETSSTGPLTTRSTASHTHTHVLFATPYPLAGPAEDSSKETVATPILTGTVTVLALKGGTDTP